MILLHRSIVGNLVETQAVAFRIVTAAFLDFIMRTAHNQNAVSKAEILYSGGLHHISHFGEKRVCIGRHHDSHYDSMTEMFRVAAQ